MANNTLYEGVTAEIIAAIEAGAETFRMPWHSAGALLAPLNAITRRAYRGINVVLLWAAAARANYRSGEWATCQQWRAAGAKVRKGERSTVVLLWKPVSPKGQPDGEEAESARGRTFARAFHVFNAAQVDGYEPVRQPELASTQRIARAEAFFAALPATVWSGSDQAFFDPAADIISMPNFAAFRSPEAFYSVLGHEYVHWTGAKARLDRDLRGRFGSERYAAEELIAELGAAFLGAHLGLHGEPRRDHAPYIAGWLRALRSDARAITTAASRAQAAADYLVGLSQASSGFAAREKLVNLGVAA